MHFCSLLNSWLAFPYWISLVLCHTSTTERNKKRHSSSVKDAWFAFETFTEELRPTCTLKFLECLLFRSRLGHPLSQYRGLLSVRGMPLKIFYPIRLLTSRGVKLRKCSKTGFLTLLIQKMQRERLFSCLVFLPSGFDQHTKGSAFMCSLRYSLKCTSILPSCSTWVARYPRSWAVKFVVPLSPG